MGPSSHGRACDGMSPGSPWTALDSASQGSGAGGQPARPLTSGSACCGAPLGFSARPVERLLARSPTLRSAQHGTTTSTAPWRHGTHLVSHSDHVSNLRLCCGDGDTLSLLSLSLSVPSARPSLRACPALPCPPLPCFSLLSVVAHPRIPRPCPSQLFCTRPACGNAQSADLPTKQSIDRARRDHAHEPFHHHSQPSADLQSFVLQLLTLTYLLILSLPATPPPPGPLTG